MRLARRQSRSSVLTSAFLLLVGQAFLLLVEPLTRANGTFAEVRGIAILVPDSQGYLRSAETFTGVFSWPWMRIGYPFLLYVLGLGTDAAQTVVVVHALALVGAGTLLHRHVTGVAGSGPASFAVAVLLANPMTAQWVRIVMTESLFFSLVVVITVLSCRILAGDRSLPVHATHLVAASLALFTRPNGIFVFSSAIALLLIAHLNGRKRIVAVSVLWTVVLMILPAFNAAVGPPSEGSLTSQLYDGVVVEGTDHVRVTIAMPAPSDISDESLTAGARYAFAHPVAMLRLGSSRIAYETLQVRPHYPLIVNLAFGSAMLAYLAVIALGWRQPEARSARTVAVTLSVPLLALTSATFAVPEGRYGWAYLLPFIPLAAFGVDRLTPIRSRLERSAQASRRSTS